MMPLPDSRVVLPILVVMLMLTALGRAVSQEAGVRPHDLVLRGGVVVDGTGAAPRQLDVAIGDGRIVALGQPGTLQGRKVLDIGGLHLSPGFIDPHSHASKGLISRELSGAVPLLVQGITTVVVNPDGGGIVDLVGQRELLLEHGLGVNVGQLVPFGSVRKQILGQRNRAPDSGELDQMKALVRAGMDAGAMGFSTGLFYAPQNYATTGEVVELARVAGEYGGVYQSHIRDESDYTVGLMAAVEEVIRVSRESGLKGVVTHIKALGSGVWGKSGEVIDLIEEARGNGVEIYADQYPYLASSTNLFSAVIPRWAQEGGRKSLKKKLEDPGFRTKVSEGVRENLTRRGGAARQRLTGRGNLAGKTLAAIAGVRKTPVVDTALDLVSTGSTSIVSFNMDEDDVKRFMACAWTMTCSDGGLRKKGGSPHPRNCGTFPRKIRRYVVEKGFLDLAHAIRSMTGLTAGVYGLEGRGVIRVGAVADIAVFDLDKFRDMATYDAPQEPAVGMVHVLVGGRFAIRDGKATGLKAGGMLDRGK